MAFVFSKVRLKWMCWVLLPFSILAFVLSLMNVQSFYSRIEPVYRLYKNSPLQITSEKQHMQVSVIQGHTIPGEMHTLTPNESSYSHENPKKEHRIKSKKTDQSKMKKGKLKNVTQEEDCNCVYDDVHYTSACSFSILDDATIKNNRLQRQNRASKNECLTFPQCHDIPNLFRQTMNQKEINAFLDLLTTFTKAMDKIGGTYFVAGGTVLGSMRHHGFIPWDDDIDVYVPLSQKGKMTSGLEYLSPNYKFAYRRPMLMKFFPQKSTRVKKLNYGWPAIDIFFYKSNSTHLECQLLPKFLAKRTYFSMKNIFPLRKRPFCNTIVNIANNPLAYLKEMYRGFDMASCLSRDVNHRRQEPLSYTMKGKPNIQCKDVYHVYPHVKRKILNSTHIEEELYAGDKMLNRIILVK